MRLEPRQEDPIFNALLPVIRGTGFDIVELSVSRHKGGTAQVRLTICRPQSDAPIGTEDCAKVHKAIVPRLDLAFGKDEDYSLMVMTPGIDRTVKDAAELPLYIGRKVRVWQNGASDWIYGRLDSLQGSTLTVTPNVDAVNEAPAVTLELENVSKVKLAGG
jgi:ribosome maturation factor RimP